jgi:hypothetical protein
MEKLLLYKKDAIQAKFDGMFREEVTSTTTGNARSCYDYEKVDYSTHLNSKYYTACMQHLLWMEEVQMRIDSKSYDLHNAPLMREGQYLYKLHVPGLAECRPSIIKGDKIIIYVKGGGGGMKFEGIVHRTCQEYAIMDLPKVFTRTYIDGLRVDVRFTFTRTSLRTCHQAMVAMKSMDEDSQLRKMIFPSSMDIRPVSAVNTRIIRHTQLRFYDRSLNQEQQLAVVGIIQSVARPAPYLIYGPPGENYFMSAVDVAQSLSYPTLSLPYRYWQDCHPS